jgi:hypothetical protein
LDVRNANSVDSNIDPPGTLSHKVRVIANCSFVERVELHHCGASACSFYLARDSSKLGARTASEMDISTGCRKTLCDSRADYAASAVNHGDFVFQ